MYLTQLHLDHMQRAVADREHFWCWTETEQAAELHLIRLLGPKCISLLRESADSYCNVQKPETKLSVFVIVGRKDEPIDYHQHLKKQ